MFNALFFARRSSLLLAAFSRLAVLVIAGLSLQSLVQGQAVNNSSYLLCSLPMARGNLRISIKKIQYTDAAGVVHLAFKVIIQVDGRTLEEKTLPTNASTAYEVGLGFCDQAAKAHLFYGQDPDTIPPPPPESLARPYTAGTV